MGISIPMRKFRNSMNTSQSYKYGPTRMCIIIIFLRQTIQWQNACFVTQITWNKMSQILEMCSIIQYPFTLHYFRVQISTSIIITFHITYPLVRRKCKTSDTYIIDFDKGLYNKFFGSLVRKPSKYLVLKVLLNFKKSQVNGPA